MTFAELWREALATTDLSRYSTSHLLTPSYLTDARGQSESVISLEAKIRVGGTKQLHPPSSTDIGTVINPTLHPTNAHHPH